MRVVVSVIGIVCALAFHHTAWLYLLENRVSSECVCRLIPLIISNLTDEDVHLHQRTSSLSASVIGTSGLIGKIGQSIAPMLGFMLFKGSQWCDSATRVITNGKFQKHPHTEDYELTVDGNGLGVEIEQWAADGVKDSNYDCSGRYHEVIAPMLIALVPLVAVVSQIVLWHKFSLHGTYLSKVKASRNSRVSKASV